MDTYQKLSIKGSTRETRGNEEKVLFEENDELPGRGSDQEFKNVMMNDDNKTKFNKIIAEHAANPLF